MRWQIVHGRRDRNHGDAVPARVVMVMRAALGFVDQLAVEPGVGQFFDGGPGLSGANGDALLRKEGQRAPPDAAGDHDVRTLLAQPAREKARRVRRRVSVRMSRILRCAGSVCTSVNSVLPPKCPCRRPSVVGMAMVMLQ